MAEIPEGIPLALSSYRSESLAISAQQIVNMYALIQKKGMDAKGTAPLIGTPGLVQFAAIGAGPIRAVITLDDVLYAVSGAELYSVDANGTGTLLGAGIAAGSNVLGISENGTQIIIVDGAAGFTFTPPATFAQIVDGDFLPAKTVCFLKSYFLFDNVDTNKFFSSASDDGASYDATFFARAETNSDNVEACLSYQQSLYITGHKGIEPWQFNPNTSGFPWVSYPNSVIDTGVAGPFAAFVHKGAFYFVGSDRLFYRIEGGAPINKSDPGVAAAWNSYGDISDAVVWGITWNNQEWIYITFPTALHTWVFDASTELFHERESHNSAMQSYGRWRGNCYARCYNKHLVGDAFSNKIGYLDANTYTEFGEPMRARAVSPFLHNAGATVFMSSLEFLMETGVGLTSGQGSDPMMVLDWTDDGQTFSMIQLQKSIGAKGNFKLPVRFTEMGSFESRAFRVTITDPVKRVIISVVPKVKTGLLFS